MTYCNIGITIILAGLTLILAGLTLILAGIAQTITEHEELQESSHTHTFVKSV